MRLEDLARAQPFALPLAVPPWTLGCFKRRCISFATGEEDTFTEVIWIQSHGLTGDLRLPANRPRPSAARLEDCTREELIEWARGEGFAARTSWADGHMSWDAFAAFQPYDKWPEPGRLERVGACLIEWAPSGIYVEDWRFQPGSGGLLAGLRLISQTGADGVERPRDGALVIAGDHALLVLGRDGAMDPVPLHEQIAPAADPHALARRIFEAEVSYGRRQADGFFVERSINPFREGQALFAQAGWDASGQPEVIFEYAEGPPKVVLRRWRIDTLLADQTPLRATECLPQGAAWLAARRDALGLNPGLR